jgi:hypothetical protein
MTWNLDRQKNRKKKPKNIKIITLVMEIFLENFEKSHMHIIKSKRHKV